MMEFSNNMQVVLLNNRLTFWKPVKIHNPMNIDRTIIIAVNLDFPIQAFWLSVKMGSSSGWIGAISKTMIHHMLLPFPNKFVLFSTTFKLSVPFLFKQISGTILAHTFCMFKVLAITHTLNLSSGGTRLLIFSILLSVFHMKVQPGHDSSSTFSHST